MPHDLVCPETRQELRPADPAVLERLNRQVASGALRNRAGHVVKERIEAGLVRVDGQVLYPIRDNIPLMLVGEAILIGAPVS